MEQGSITAFRLRVLAGALLFSTGGAAIKLCSLTGFQVAAVRSALAFVFCMLFLPVSRHHWNLKCLLVAVAYCWTLATFVIANKLTTAASTICLQFTAPLYILLLSPLLLREPITRHDLVLAAVLGAGFACFFLGLDAPAKTAPDPLTGNIIAAASGVGWAFTIMGLRWLAREAPGEGRAASAMALGNLFVVAVCLPWCFPFEMPGTQDWAVLGYLGFVQIGLAYLLLASGMGRVPAFETALLLLVEPVLSPLWAFIVHDERPGPFSILGGAIIVVATLSHTLLKQSVASGSDPNATPDTTRPTP